MGKYFGTDGIRGVFGEDLPEELCYKTGVAIATLFGKGEYIIGRDTRVSGEDIEALLVKGLVDSGCTAILLGVIPTPAVAYTTTSRKACCGVMISASHNPPEYNGIKVFDNLGLKLSEEKEGSIEYYIDNPPNKLSHDGTTSVLHNAREKYIEHLVKSVNCRLEGLKIWLDCGYGASSTVAQEAFTRLGASVTVENYKLRGEKINCGCGALYPYYIRNSMKGTDTMLGFSFDGDADRLSIVYDGEILDGDSIIYNLACTMPLKDNVVVGTVLTNLALEQQLEKDGKRLVRTPVGDKFICELMNNQHFNLGGEQSGHFILYPYATTGDGILSAMFFARSIFADGILKKAKVLELCPQKAIAEYASPSIMYEKSFVELIDASEKRLKGIGRLIVRMSGTEPKVRVMAECRDASLVEEVLASFKAYFKSAHK